MPDPPADYYATLGLDRGCTPEQIRSAYRLLSKRCHPDLHPGDPDAAERARELNAAHAVLSDAARRRAYDAELADADQEERTQIPAAKLERNVQQDVLLRPDELLRGTRLEITVRDPGEPESYELDVPPGTAPGTRLRIPRAREEGGHVVVRVKVRPGGRFKVKGADLRCELRTNARRAAQGGSETVPGITGTPVRVPIEPGTARGTVVRVAGEGLPTARGGRGDLLVKVTYRPEVRVSRVAGPRPF